MGKKIELTPEILRGQASRMDALEGQYDSLFSSVTSTLNNVNNNWSEYLSNNFTDKIISAQNSFSAIVSSLEYGGTAARTSAETFDSIDSQLAKGIDGQGNISGASLNLGQNVADSMMNNISELQQILKNDIETNRTTAEEILKSYDDLPKWAQEIIDKILEGVTGDEDACKKIMLLMKVLKEDPKNFVNMQFDSSIAKDVLKLVGLSKNPYAQTSLELFKGAQDLLKGESDRKWVQLANEQERLRIEATNQINTGDVLGGLATLSKSLGVGLLGLGVGVADVATETMAGVWDAAAKPADIVLSVMESVPGGLGKELKDFSKVTSAIIHGPSNFLKFIC